MRKTMKKAMLYLLAFCLLTGVFAAAPLGASASQLFIQWDNLPVYGVVDALMLLCVAGFCLTAAWAINGCRFPRGKMAVLTTVFLARGGKKQNGDVDPCVS